MKEYKIAILGATGLVGQEFLKILEERNFPISDIILTASSNSEGKKILFKGENLTVKEAKKEIFKGVDIIFSSAGASVSKNLLPDITNKETIAIDNTSAFRMYGDVPLVVPEVNSEDLKKHNGIISNPNCSTIQLVVALKPLNDFIPIKRVIVSTYQAVSGAGNKAIQEMYKQIKDKLENKPLNYEKTILPQVIAFNVIPHGGNFLENDYTEEEMKIVNETKKIMNLPNLKITATSVRVPVINGHSESVNIEFEKEFSPEKAKELLSNFKGIKLIDNPKNKEYPMPIFISGKNDVFVGRIRKDTSCDNALNMFIVADNIRKGAALNAIQIAEKMIEMNLL
ncbi:MAG: aspartate-semialdehyde dehydrogenase [Candidatus Sericytochromatia bacterium]|nr:MAG: aspartate-semialdehyde dehydrogenase [Candidatus Sericytochromatia bacterium]